MSCSEPAAAWTPDLGRPMATATAPPAQRAGPPAPREMVTIRARDKATGKDLIITVPRGASMDEVMAAYTAKFNAQEGKSLARDEFRFVSNGATVGGGDRVEDLPASHAAYGGDGARAAGGAASDDDDDDDDADAPDAFGCGGVSCQAGDAADAGCAVM